MRTLSSVLSEKNRADAEAGVSRQEKVLRRVVAPLAAVALLGAGAFAAVEKGEQGPQPYNISHEYRTYTAQPGDTLFSIAERAEPNQDPRDVAKRIELTIELWGAATFTQSAHAETPASPETIYPGEHIPLPADAKIGDLTELA
jgi:hypothetical protein